MIKDRRVVWHGENSINNMLILASKSPRRQEILKKYGYDFEVLLSNANENVENLSAKNTVEYLSRIKALSVYERVNENYVVIGADTVVEFDGKILGKPKTQTEAYDMLKSMIGKSHNVYTGITIVTKDKRITESVLSTVKFNNLSEEFILEYIKTGSPMDKAGAYGIQDGNIVEKYNGSYYNIVGLPIERLSEILFSFGVTPKK